MTENIKRWLGGAPPAAGFAGTRASTEGLQQWAALLKHSPAKHHHFPTGFLIPEWEVPKFLTFSAPFAPRTHAPPCTRPLAECSLSSSYRRQPWDIHSIIRYPVTQSRRQPQKTACFPLLRLSPSSSRALISDEISERGSGSKVGVSLRNPLFRDGWEKTIPPRDRGFALRQTLPQVLKCTSGVTPSRLSLPSRLYFAKGSGSEVGSSHPVATNSCNTSPEAHQPCGNIGS